MRVHVCVCATYFVRLQYELNNIARVIGQGSYCGARNQLTVVLQYADTINQSSIAADASCIICIPIKCPPNKNG